MSRSSLNSEAQAASARVDSIESIKMIPALLENHLLNSRDDRFVLGRGRKSPSPRSPENIGCRFRRQKKGHGGYG